MKSSSKYPNLVIFGTARLSELITAYLKIETSFKICGYSIEKEYINNRKIFLDKPLVDFGELENAFPPSEYSLFIAVGNNYTRERIYTESKEKGYSFMSHISPKAVQDVDVSFGENVFVTESANLQPFVRIGNNTIITGSKIGHHAKVGNHVMLSCSTIGGGVKIGDYSFLGLNSAVQHDTVIGERNIIGMGCSIHKNTKANEVYTSNSSTIKRKITADQISHNYL
jgi:sugar O-acyltransferase (sialic acid O-acetyltransferase NeuD family)